MLFTHTAILQEANMEKDINSLELMSKEELLEFAKKLVEGGVSLSFYGKRTAQVIERKVMPRIVKVNRSLSFNDDQENSQNIIVDGENLQAKVIVIVIWCTRLAIKK